MAKVFVDAAAWIALLNQRDSLHQQAKAVNLKLRQQSTRLVTTEFVLLEVADAFCTISMRMRAVHFLDSLRLLPILHIIPIEQTLLEQGWELYKQRPDKNWSLTDCISFAVMNKEKIVQSFTSDHHFEQAGFKKLM